MPNAFLLLTLADDCEVHAHLKSVKAADASVTCDILHLAVPSPTAHRFWSTILQLHGARLRFSKTNTGQLRGLDISLQGHSLRFRIPYKYQAHHFVDEAVSVAKSCKQVYSQLLLGLPSSVLEPHPEGPKHLPRFECSLSEVAIEAEDDPLENRLNLSRRVGTQEARNRLERAAALEAKEKEAIEIFAPNEAAAMLEAARIHLRKYDASELTHRLRNAFAEQGKREETLYRRLEGDFPFSREASPLQLTASNKACPLVRAIFYGFYVQISPPSSFPPTLDGVKAYLNEVGGMPTDRDFSLLVPLHIRWTITDARIRLRDYPLPLVHLPQSAHANKEHRPAWNFDSDFVIAEQIPEAEALRYTVQELVPATYSGASDQGHHIVVPRSAMPTQFYGLPRIHLSPDKQVTMGWGNSMQPALNDVARVVESLTKPSPDPSPRLGFWDKLRLSVHGKLVMTSSVDLHVHLKGSRDPYALEGAGAGFVKIWRGNVKLLVNCTNNDHELLQILSDRYVLGVPDLTPYIDSAAAGMSGNDSPSEGSFQPGGSHGDSLPVQVSLQKTLGVLVNGVRWGMGFRLERTCARGHCPRAQPCEGNKFQRKCRVFEFRPHYDVKTRLEAGPKDENGKVSSLGVLSSVPLTMIPTFRSWILSPAFAPTSYIFPFPSCPLCHHKRRNLSKPKMLSMDYDWLHWWISTSGAGGLYLTLVCHFPSGKAASSILHRRPPSLEERQLRSSIALM